jgi:uncharacterized protein (TIGR02118 family)
MIRVSAYYPSQPGARFDHGYYAGEHRALVRERLAPFGLREVEMERGVAGLGGGAPHYVAVGHLDFESLEAFERAWEAHGEEIAADIPRYTDIQPIVEISEFLPGS